MIDYTDFERVDIRVGKIISAEEYLAASKPSYKLDIDFGKEIGIKRSIGQFKQNYKKNELVGMLVACVVNLPPRQIGPSISEVLTLGFPDDQSNAVLITLTKNVSLGVKLY